jgi:hypothetical protein
LQATGSATARRSVRFTDVQVRPTEFLDLTSLTLDEFQQLIPPCKVAFQAHLTAWRLDGKPRTARRFTVYKHCPLATPEDRLFFLLTYLKTYALQVVHGRLFGMGQSKATQWIHVVLPALLTALRALGDAPARSLTALAQRLGVSEADAVTVVVPLEEAPAPLAAAPTGVPVSPLLPMTGPNGASSAPTTLLHRQNVIPVINSAAARSAAGWCGVRLGAGLRLAAADRRSQVSPNREANARLCGTGEGPRLSGW